MDFRGINFKINPLTRAGMHTGIPALPEWKQLVHTVLPVTFDGARNGGMPDPSGGQREGRVEGAVPARREGCDAGSGEAAGPSNLFKPGEEGAADPAREV